MRAGSEYKQISEAYTNVYAEADTDIESPAYLPGTEVGLTGLVTPGRVGKGILKVFSPVWKAEIALGIAAGTKLGDATITGDFERRHYPAGGQWPGKYWIDKDHRVYYDAASVPEKVEYLKHHRKSYPAGGPGPELDPTELEKELTAVATRDPRGS